MLHKETWCPLRANTIANAVPHAPAPNTTMECDMIQIWFGMVKIDVWTLIHIIIPMSIIDVNPSNDEGSDEN